VRESVRSRGDRRVVNGVAFQLSCRLVGAGCWCCQCHIQVPPLNPPPRKRDVVTALVAAEPSLVDGNWHHCLRGMTARVFSVPQPPPPPGPHESCSTHALVEAAASAMQTSLERRMRLHGAEVLRGGGGGAGVHTSPSTEPTLTHVVLCPAVGIKSSTQLDDAFASPEEAMIAQLSPSVAQEVRTLQATGKVRVVGRAWVDALLLTPTTRAPDEAFAVPPSQLAKVTHPQVKTHSFPF
jgi:hypothetical protein